MIKLFNKINDWFEKRTKIWFLITNRPAHFLIALIGSILLGIGFGIGAGLALEFKDKSYGGKFDYLDLSITFIGGVIGGMINIYIICLILGIF